MFRPFSEPLLNVSNPLSEAGILLIFSLASVNLMDIPRDYHDFIDQMLVGILNAIMGIQMATSVIVFVRTVYLIIRKKCQKKVVPIKWAVETKISRISEVNETEIISKNN